MASELDLDFFGELLMTRVRDKAISEWDRIMDGRAKGITAKVVKKALENFSEEQKKTVGWLLPKVVDSTIHHLLWTFEQELVVDIVVKKESGTVNSIRDLSDGLSGELYTQDGWIVRFSKQRYEEF